MVKALSKNDVRDVVQKVLEPFAAAVQTDFKKVNERLDNIEVEVHATKIGLQEVKAEVREMKENASELFTKLDKFITLYETQRQEFAILSTHLRRLEERIDKLETRRIQQ
ncbi:MAG: hypothetical protein Q7R85_01565 [bacterium]|nr:hypothetical protein [bacterium]